MSIKNLFISNNLIELSKKAAILEYQKKYFFLKLIMRYVKLMVTNSQTQIIL